MKKGEIIDFVVLRIQSELDRYQRTKTIPHSILDGTYDIEEVAGLYIDKLTPKYQMIAKRLHKEYNQHIAENIESLREALRREYTSVMKNLHTNHSSFYYSDVMNLYRPDMNPVRALYYQTREVIRRYNPEDPHHYWLIDLVTDREYNNIICDALAKDVKKLERIIKRYYFSIVKHSDGVPLELFHAKRTLQDYRHFYNFFADIKHFVPDE